MGSVVTYKMTQECLSFHVAPHNFNLTLWAMWQQTSHNHNQKEAVPSQEQRWENPKETTQTLTLTQQGLTDLKWRCHRASSSHRQEWTKFPTDVKVVSSNEASKRYI